MTEENPYRSPVLSTNPTVSTTPDDEVWRDGDLLVMTKRAKLPPRCTRCNAPTDIRLKRKLSWHPPAWYLLIAVSIWIYIIAALIVRHTATVEVGYCDLHRRKRRRAIAIGWALALSGVVLFGLGADSKNSAPVFLLLGLVLLMIGLVYGVFGSRVVSPKRINDRYVWLKQVSSEYLAELPPWIEA